MSNRNLIWLAFFLMITGANAAERPNIIYILADDLGYGDVHCLNPEHGKIATPHIDRLASQGMVFTDAHSGSSVCTPTRYGILTGRYAWRTRLQKGVLSDYVKPLISADRLTVPKLLQQHGYHTSCVGKWHLGFTIAGAEDQRKPAGRWAGAPLGAITRDGPLTRGFNRFFGFHHARMMKSVFQQDRVTQYVEPVDMLPLLTDTAVEFIERNGKSGKPFFLYLPLSAPHTPIVPGDRWQGRSELGEYGDFVMQIDGVVGEVLKALDQTDAAHDTIVIVTSDNGCSKAAGLSELHAKGHYPSAGFRGSKADIFEGGHRIPFIVRWPKTIKAGSTSQQTICLTDLMATCADLLDTQLPADAGEDSVSTLPALLGTNSSPLREAVVHHSINGSFAIRKDKWKLALCPGSGGWSKPRPGDKSVAKLPPIQLYNLASDIEESTNLQAEHPELVEQLINLLKQYVQDGRSTPGPRQSNDAKIVLVKPM